MSDELFSVHDVVPRWHRLFQSYRPKPPPPWWQFSLRAMLLFVTTCCIVMAVTRAVGFIFLVVVLFYIIPFVVVPLLMHYRYQAGGKNVVRYLIMLVALYFCVSLFIPAIH